MKPGTALLLALAACGGNSGASPDAATDLDGAITLDGPIDPPVGPSGVDCFYDWQSLEGCGAPVVTAAYLTNNCQATTGVFVVGTGFQSANLFMVDNAWLPYGPEVISTSWNRDSWNVLTPTFMCLTTSASPDTWSGFPIHLRNPDGQLSNSVTVQNLLGMRPPLISTGSNDPFDPDACLDAGMTHAEALATFAPAASTSTLGAVTIVSRSRSCNTATGCLPWGAATTVASNVVAGLVLTDGGSTVNFTFEGDDCGELGEHDRTLTYNSCPEYEVHVAAHCLRAASTVRSAIAGDGNYTQTDSAALLRY
jgi:hypothetical protein